MGNIDSKKFFRQYLRRRPATQNICPCPVNELYQTTLAEGMRETAGHMPDFERRSLVLRDFALPRKPNSSSSREPSGGLRLVEAGRTSSPSRQLDALVETVKKSKVKNRAGEHCEICACNGLFQCDSVHIASSGKPLCLCTAVCNAPPKPPEIPSRLSDAQKKTMDKDAAQRGSAC